MGTNNLRKLSILHQIVTVNTILHFTLLALHSDPRRGCEMQGNNLTMNRTHTQKKYGTQIMLKSM